MILAQQQAILQQIAHNRDQAMALIRDVRYIQRNTNLYNITATEDLGNWDLNLNKYINSQNRAAVNCITDVFNSCRLPEDAFPNVTLPTRRAYVQGTCQIGWEWDALESRCCQTQLSRFCALPGEAGCLTWETKEERVCQRV